MDSDNIYKELEPDANEIMFGQKTLPDRPLTTKEESKREKILLKLVDQKLKFKLVELMRQQVTSQRNSQQETSGTTAVPPVSQTINDSHSSSNYRSWSDSSVHHARGNCQQHYSAELQLSAYPSYYETTVNTSWNCAQPNVQSKVQNNFQYAHQNLNSNKSFKRKRIVSSNLMQPSLVNVRGINNNQFPMEISTEQLSKKIAAPHSTLISITCKETPPSKSIVINPTTKNQLLAAPVSNMPNPIPNIHQIPQLPHPSTIEKFTTNRPMPRRRRRYGRGTNELKKQVKASAQADGNVVLKDKFGLRCIGAVTSNAARDGSCLWNEVSRLVGSIFRKESNQIEPLSSYEQKLQKKILIEISTNPDVLRSDKDVSQFLTRIKLEEMISKVKMILQQVNRSNANVQSDFARFRENLISDLTTMNEQVNVANETENVQLIRTKINEIVSPFLSVDVDEAPRNELVLQLVTNPRALETSEAITKTIPDKMSVMREIKRILDEHMTARPGKRFYIPIHRTIDVPFVAAVHEKNNRISEENLKILRDTLIVNVERIVSPVKPKIIDPKFVDGTLVMVCANRKTFDLIKMTILGDFTGKWTGADLVVTPVEIKNPLARNELKTVVMKFTDPQFYHFNDLMVQLKVDNPSLLVRRWELREPPGKVIDSTEGIYVGVDMESLVPIEQLNRVTVLLKSTVTFEICYDDSERNYLPDHSLLTK